MTNERVFWLVDLALLESSFLHGAAEVSVENIGVVVPLLGVAFVAAQVGTGFGHFLYR